MHGVNTILVTLVAGSSMRLANLVRGGQLQFLLQRLQVGLQKIKTLSRCFCQHGVQVRVYHCVEYDRVDARALCSLADTLDGSPGFFTVVDIGNHNRLVTDIVKLRQYALAESFGGNAGAVGNKKNRALLLHDDQ